MKIARVIFDDLPRPTTHTTVINGRVEVVTTNWSRDEVTGRLVEHVHVETYEFTSGGRIANRA